MQRLIIFVFLLFVGVGNAPAQQTTDAATTMPGAEVVGARVSAGAERARLILDLSALTEFAVVSLGSPMRIAVDVRADGVKGAFDGKPAGEGIVGSFEVEQVEPGRVRTWLVLSAPAKVQQAYLLDSFDDQPARLVVDLIPANEKEFAVRAAQDYAASLAGQTRESTDDISGVMLHAKPLILIDPGHGGNDAGAHASNGVQEKNIVLIFAKALQELLVATGKFDVALTRDDDRYLSLEQRVALARAHRADLFISLHADSFQEPTIRGASVYTRDEDATDILDKVLADKENRVDIIAGFAVPQMEEKVVDILVDLMRREMRQQSFRAAESIVAQLKPSVRLRRLPVRQADFFVLQAPDVPSILIELGFMSNETDLKDLTTREWRDRVSEALARGIAVYFDGFMQK